LRQFGGALGVLFRVCLGKIDAETAAVTIVERDVENFETNARRDQRNLFEGIVFQMFVADCIDTVALQHGGHVTLLASPDSVGIQQGINVFCKLDGVGQVVKHGDGRNHFATNVAECGFHIFFCKIGGQEFDVAIEFRKLLAGGVDANAANGGRIQLEHGGVVASNVDNNVAVVKAAQVGHNLLLVILEVGAHGVANPGHITVLVLIKLASQCGLLELEEFAAHA